MSMQPYKHGATRAQIETIRRDELLDSAFEWAVLEDGSADSVGEMVAHSEMLAKARAYARSLKRWEE